MDCSFEPAARGREAGFSLFELMIAIVILGIISSQMFVVLSTQKRVYTGETRDLDLQESARMIADLIAFDTRNAGMMVPREAAVSSVDGGSTGSDRVCLSASNYFNPRPGTGWDSTPNRFEGAFASFTGANTLTVSTTDIDGMDGANDWVFGGQTAGIILAQVDGRRTHCDRIQAMVGSSITLQNPLPTGALALSAAANTVKAVPAVVYEITPPTGEMAVPPAAPKLLLRNGVTISTQIEDLQVEFWIDNQGPTGTPNGVVDLTAPKEFPIHALNISGGLAQPDPSITPLSRIRNVRISVVARAALADEAGKQIVRHRRPALANRKAATATDGFTRRVYTVSVLPRNLLDPNTISNVP